MERYLLFDSKCLQCSQIARTIEQFCDGWCAVRSLHEPSMQEFLVKANSQWKWEPTLLEVQETDMRIFTGVALRLHLLRELGPRKAWQLLQAIGKTSLSSSSTGTERRHFLKRSSAALMALALGISSMEPVHAQEIAEDSATSFSVTVLKSNDPIIHQLSQLDAVKTASRSIGIADWTSVSRVQHGASSDAVYVIVYQPHISKEAVKATFLCVASSSKAVVAQLLHANEQVMQFAWLTPEMHYLGTTITNKDGKVEVSTENPYHLGIAGNATPNFAWGCFISCLTTAHVPGWCIAICETCSFGIFPVCVPCAGCAAGAYTYCVATC